MERKSRTWLMYCMRKLLDINTFKSFRPVFLRGLQFSKMSGRFPRALIYNDVFVVESGTAITSGAFGDVWRGVLRGQAVAMKVMCTTKRPEDILRNYSKEAIAWSQLRHANVLQLSMESTVGPLMLVVVWSAWLYNRRGLTHEMPSSIFDITPTSIRHLW
ncbi:hypothetical protein BKA70DRAFT_872662 [Coprinopsis sp. MPI-PUGE-AT-0042]|nr:hypothetical protein BKA70DRAFT_872662 [Coprinopsis sp. MPI-PUGE-AT-0042]